MYVISTTDLSGYYVTFQFYCQLLLVIIYKYMYILYIHLLYKSKVAWMMLLMQNRALQF